MSDSITTFRGADANGFHGQPALRVERPRLPGRPRPEVAFIWARSGKVFLQASSPWLTDASGAVVTDIGSGGTAEELAALLYDHGTAEWVRHSPSMDEAAQWGFDTDCAAWKLWQDAYDLAAVRNDRFAALQAQEG